MTHREASSNVAFVTGHYKEEEDFEEKWKALATGIDTLVIYMGIKNVKQIERLLIENGRDRSTPKRLSFIGGRQTSRKRCFARLSRLPQPLKMKKFPIRVSSSLVMWSISALV
ncbi:hypothetical protein QKW52_26730 [Bacillus sonorensis]|nr:hypothetical protein [Bacillus sonorensis]